MFIFSILDNYNFVDEQKKSKLKTMVDYIFESEKLSGDIFFDITIVDKKESHKINLERRGKDRDTDVISFAFWDNSEIKTPLLGEIFLNYEKVISQSEEYGHSLERELFFLLSHGVYHLLGYDHLTKEEEEIMMNKQYKSLETIGLGKR